MNKGKANARWADFKIVFARPFLFVATDYKFNLYTSRIRRG